MAEATAVFAAGAAPIQDRIRAFLLVEVLRRYSNRTDLLKVVQDILRRIDQNDQTDLPGIEKRSWSEAPPKVKRLSEAERAEIVESFKRGVKIRVLAGRYGVGERCIKRTLRRHGVGRKDRSGE
jgi:hypothetical protein